MKQLSFDATISALDVETSAVVCVWGSDVGDCAEVIRCDDIGTRCGDLGAATFAIARSYWQYWCGVSGDCGVGITPQMCNRVTYHGDMSTFSKPVLWLGG